MNRRCCSRSAEAILTLTPQIIRHPSLKYGMCTALSPREQINIGNALSLVSCCVCVFFFKGLSLNLPPQSFSLASHVAAEHNRRASPAQRRYSADGYRFRIGNLYASISLPSQPFMDSKKKKKKMQSLVQRSILDIHPTTYNATHAL